MRLVKVSNLLDYLMHTFGHCFAWHSSLLVDFMPSIFNWSFIVAIIIVNLLVHYLDKLIIVSMIMILINLKVNTLNDLLVPIIIVIANIFPFTINFTIANYSYYSPLPIHFQITIALYFNFIWDNYWHIFLVLYIYHQE